MKRGQLLGVVARGLGGVVSAGRRTGTEAEFANLPAKNRGGDLVMVLSLPRSGTAAFGSLLEAGFPELSWEGEILFGHVTPRAVAELAVTYPWISEINDVAALNLPKAQRHVLHEQYRKKMESCSAEVLSLLMEARTGPTVVKVFPNHLSRPALAELVAEFRPRVVDLRRRMVFSYYSYMRASASKVWREAPGPDVDVVWREAHVRRYIESCDAWTRWCETLVATLRLPTLRASYEGLFDSRDDLPRVAEFFGDGSQPDRSNWGPETTMQDRRSDVSLTHLMNGFSRLPRDLREALLREPGR